MDLRAKILITPHAARAYRERVNRRGSEDDAEREITQALQAPLFYVPKDGGGTLWGCVNSHNHCFLALTDSADGGAEHLVVRTCGNVWFWHEARQAWRACGINPETGKSIRRTSS